ncbi:MAG: pentapeptide repeat-containing protein [Bacteroidales bacterium]|nr:pentapeptide repeat-containing protein [Bacteroidales bacterium]
MKKLEKINKFLWLLMGILFLIYLTLVIAGAFIKSNIANDLSGDNFFSADNLDTVLTIKLSESFWLNMIEIIQSTFGWLAAVLGLVWTVYKYIEEKQKDREYQKDLEKRALEEKEKERNKLEAIEKERQIVDAQHALSEIWAGLSSEKESDRAASIARLSYLIDLSNRIKEPYDFKKQIACALAFAGRQKNSKQTIETLTSVVEKAFTKFPNELLKDVSWQGLHLIKADFKPKIETGRTNLEGLNFREAILEDSNFTRCDLNNSVFESARLNGSIFNHANLTGANFMFADVAGASFYDANLSEADFRRVLWEGADLYNADFSKTKLSEVTEAWKLTRNWRRVKNLNVQFNNMLVEYYGSNTTTPKGKILMIAWEFPPFVSGGGWTALYHYIYNLNKSNWRILLFVPWPKEFIDTSIFGNEIDIISVHDKDTSPLSVYTSIYCGIYGTSFSNVYNNDMLNRKDFKKRKRTTIYGVAERYATNIEQWVLNNIDDFQKGQLPISIVYTHDWICARAGLKVKELLQNKKKNVRWFAHFHSLESDRQEKELRSKMIRKIEESTSIAADKVIAVSNFTARKISDEYNRKDLVVLPNYLSNIDDLNLATNSNMGDFDSKNVVFIGRMSSQKGPDIFVNIAHQIINEKKPGTKPHFLMYGRGPLEREIGEIVNGLFPQHPVKYNPVKSIKKNLQLFETIEPAGFQINFEKKLFKIEERYGPLSKKHSKDLEQVLVEKGFISYKIQGEWPYTHIIRMEDSSGGFNTDYLVETYKLPPPNYEFSKPVELLGELQWKERYLAFDGASLIIVPSRSEPYGLVIAEAIKWGVPVLYTADAGIAELFDQKFGAFDINKPQAVIREVHKLLTKYDYWEELLEKQKSYLGKIVYTNQTINLYNNLFAY